MPLNKKERLFYNNHKEYFNFVKNNLLEETYSKYFENVEEINSSDKDSAIETINRIINNNTFGFVEFENNDFDGLKELIKDKLPFVNLDLPVTMQVSELRKITREFNDAKHYHGLTAENIYDAITNLNKPEMILQNRNNSQNITFITSIEIRQNEKATIGFTFNFESSKLKAIVNNVDTIFGMNEENYNLYLKSKNNRKGDDNIVYKKGSRLAPIAPATSFVTFNLQQNARDSQEELVDDTSQDDIKYSKDLDKIQDDIIKEYKKIKHGKNGKILRYGLTEPLFEIVNDSINIAKDNFNVIKKELFTDIPAKYILSLEITDINGNKLDDPEIKSLSSFADRLYRNAIKKE